MKKLLAHIYVALKKETRPKIGYKKWKNKNCGGGYFVFKPSLLKSELHIVKFINEIEDEIYNEYLSKILGKLVSGIMANSYLFICTMLDRQKLVDSHQYSGNGHYDFKKVPHKLTIEKLSQGNFKGEVEYKVYESYSGRFVKLFKSSFNFDGYGNISHRLTF